MHILSSSDGCPNSQVVFDLLGVPSKKIPYIDAIIQLELGVRVVALVKSGIDKGVIFRLDCLPVSLGIYLPESLLKPPHDLSSSYLRRL